MKAVTSKEMRQIEDLAIKDMGIPSIILMENAAMALAKHCLDYLAQINGKSVLIFAGKGNNGGDGAALARLLSVREKEVIVIYLCNPDELKDDAKTNYQSIKRMGVKINSIVTEAALDEMKHIVEQADLTVDAIFGTGLGKDVSGVYRKAINMINAYANYVIAVDVPSGINADNGKVMGTAVNAEQTVTFCLPKPGLYLNPGGTFAGEVKIEPISIPALIAEQVSAQASVLLEHEIKSFLPKRKLRANKGSHGKTYVIAGCHEMPGAAVLSASAVYRTGGGIVNYCGTTYNVGVMHNALPEAVTIILADKNGFLCRESLQRMKEEICSANAVILGPGLGFNQDTCDLVYEVLENVDTNIVIDADALNAVAQRLQVLKQLKNTCVVTPHPGEMSRLTGKSIAEIVNDPVSAALNFAKEYQVVTLLKDARTIVAEPSGNYYINLSGSPAMAKAGAGDVLSGVIAALISQGMDVFTASALGAYIHGKAGELAAKELSLYSVNASDLLAYIPAALKYGDEI